MENVESGKEFPILQEDRSGFKYLTNIKKVVVFGIIKVVCSETCNQKKTNTSYQKN